jgi:hypothetical protein
MAARLHRQAQPHAADDLTEHHRKLDSAGPLRRPDNDCGVWT